MFFLYMRRTTDYRFAILLTLIFLTLSPAFAAGPYGNCEILFVGKKAPISPDPFVIPLCEEDNDFVFFATGYSKSNNRGSWSAYRLSDEMVELMNEDPLPRPKMKFRKNPKIQVKGYVQPRHDSYTNTGWDRGHLAPNGAMAWDENAQRSSFFMSNIAPQSPAMNRNIWRCFEVSIREWAENSKDTYVVVGTVGSQTTISSDRDPTQVQVNVPTHYLAMVYRTKPSPQAIGVMVPNEAGHLDIREWMMSVAELEKNSGFKFHLPKNIASMKPDLTQWPTRLLNQEYLGKLPSIDLQCPRMQ